MIDPHSPTWLTVKEHVEEQLRAARTRLEKPGLAAAETEFERGRIMALTTLVSLTTPLPTIRPGDGTLTPVY